MTDYASFRPSKLWKRLPVERRTEAATLFWSDEQSLDQQMEAVSAIASHMKFRPRSIVDLPIEKKARYLATLLSLGGMPQRLAAQVFPHRDESARTDRDNRISLAPFEPHTRGRVVRFLREG